LETGTDAEDSGILETPPENIHPDRNADRRCLIGRGIAGDNRQRRGTSRRRQNSVPLFLPGSAKLGDETLLQGIDDGIEMMLIEEGLQPATSLPHLPALCTISGTEAPRVALTGIPLNDRIENLVVVTPRFQDRTQARRRVHAALFHEA